MTLASQSLAEFVKQDFHAAAIFEKYHLDFCCHGRTPLAEACRAHNLDVEKVLAELQALSCKSEQAPDYSSMPIDKLIAHILDTHHVYVRKMLPIITEHLSKVLQKHGATHPELTHINHFFQKVKFDLEMHLQKEEVILFPYILALHEASEKHVAPPRAHFGTVRNPIRMMELEHDAAGEDFKKIRELTNNFTPPADACDTYQVLFKELEEFERDLHIHIFLENELVHKQAILLEQKLLQSAMVSN